MEYAEMLKDFGPILGVVLFFIWRDWKREDRLADRVEQLETYQQETLVELVKETTTVIAQNTEQIRWMGTLIQVQHGDRCNGAS